ncbi:FecR domain-containing protein [Gemmata sp.]|uniref:FecR domain-containing protein n=1 Tax=Gemmata sp. TaxID=1914242 RepID=UPI003F72C136
MRTVFEGPAAFQFEGAGVVRLTSGRLFCDVPKGAEGFSVQTANGRVVDLGTRFGVEIDSGGETEVHVTAGRVRAEISDSVTRQELHAGQAGRFRSGGAAVTLVPYQRAKFATASGLIYEPFNYPPRLPLVGQGGWFDRDATLPLPNIGARDIRPYPPLPEPRGRGLELNRAAGRASRPVGRPWPAPFASSLVWIDDDFIRGMRPSRGGAVGLLGFGQPDPAGAAVRLVVKPGTRDANFGLQTGEQTLWCPRACKHHETHFVVLETGRSAARLWVNPSPVAFEADGPPPADVEVPFPAPPKVGTLWIGQPGTPAFAWWQVAELRGGYSWADVTPRTAGQ